MSTLADQPFGKPLLWVLAIGLVALAVWQLAELFRWRPRLNGIGEAKKKAIRQVGQVGVEGRGLRRPRRSPLSSSPPGSGKSSSQQQQQTVAGVFSWPAGRFLVGDRGAGAHRRRRPPRAQGHHEALHEGDRHQPRPRPVSAAPSSGSARSGYPAKGVALALVGGLLGWAAITFDPKKASGLDGAMRTLLDAPFGKVLLTLVALGIAAFGVFGFFRARFPERT